MGMWVFIILVSLLSFKCARCHNKKLVRDYHKTHRGCHLADSLSSQLLLSPSGLPLTASPGGHLSPCLPLSLIAWWFVCSVTFCDSENQGKVVQ